MFEVNELDLYYEDCPDTLDEDLKGASSDEVLVACLNRIGRVDLELMSLASGKSCEELIADLRGSAIFQDPGEFEFEDEWDLMRGWLLKAQYCSGNLRQKLEMAILQNRRFPGIFESNIRVLEKLLPPTLSLADIHVLPGAPWIPADMIAAFAKSLLRLKTAPSVFFNKELCTWDITSPEEAKDSVFNTMTYGTHRLSALKILEYTMNNKTVKVYDSLPTLTPNKYERIFNRGATLAAQEKEKEILREFKKWIFGDAERIRRLEECYNEEFVGCCAGVYDGSFLKFPDLNPAVSFFDHQRNAIARMLLSAEHLLLAHDVGTGKTYEICAGVHELYRMKISRKNLVVVPNNVLKATVNAHKYLYPRDKILAVYPKDFTPADRPEVLRKMRDGDYIAIYMAYSSFDMIVMSKGYWVKKMTDEIQSLRSAIACTLKMAEKKLLERQKDQLSKKLMAFITEAADTPWLPFDKLGIETLVVDEAHNYKNIPLYSRADNIVGMHGQGSRKCKEMLEKTRVVKKVVFATGTPLTNSLSDLYVLQTYLQPDEMKFRGISTFDMWVNTFGGEKETNFEVDVDSKQLRAVTRFNTFHNLTELMSLFSTVCDFHHLEENDDELPDFKGYQDVCIPKSRSQESYIKELSRRTELIRTRQVKRTEDNLLKVTTDGRKCALDIRLVDPKSSVLQNEKTKISACAEKILRVYRDYPDTCQVVFSDIGTPKAAFNVYDALRFELICKGIPDHEIAFVHDATGENARAKLFFAINAGDVRVVIGSTQKLGVGVNVQEKLIALHHLSVPWRPADMVQREGRILRRGNTCKEVQIFRYVTEGSFDSYSWQLLENKQRFISSFLSGTSTTRDADDVADVVLNYAEIKALAIGNPLIKKRVETANRLERTKISCRQRQRQMLDLQTVVERVPSELDRLTRLLEITRADAAAFAENRQVIPMDERSAFGEELLEAILDNEMQKSERLFDTYQGFSVYLPAGMDLKRPFVYVRSENGGVYRLEMETEKPLGCAMRIDHLLEGLCERVVGISDQIETNRKRRREAELDLEKGNPYVEEVEKLEEELASIDEKLSLPDEQSA